MRVVLILLSLLALLNTIYNATLPLYIDEAYYYLWSQRLDFSYFDHPPMVAYLMYIFSFLGDSEAALRMVTIFCMSGAGLFVYLLAREVHGREVALWAFMIAITLPAVTMGYTIVTPDSPLILFFAGALYFSLLALRDDRLGDYFLAGVFIGFALMSKYTAVLIYGVLGLYIIFKEPKKLLSPKAWLAIVVSILVFSPVIFWNYFHDWISFGFQYKHGSSEEFQIHWNKFFEFFGGQFLVFSPIFFGASFVAAWKISDFLKDKNRFFIAISFLSPLAFFLYKALFARLELNWGVIAFIGGAILTANYLYQRGLKKVFIAGLVLSLIIGLVIKFPLFFGLEGKLNPHNRIFGYKELATHLKEIKKPQEFVFADHLTRAAILEYYLKERVFIPVSTRPSQYTYWDAGINFSRFNGVLASKDERFDELSKIYKSVERLPKFTAQKSGFESREFFIYRVANP